MIFLGFCIPNFKYLQVIKHFKNIFHIQLIYNIQNSILTKLSIKNNLHQILVQNKKRKATRKRVFLVVSSRGSKFKLRQFSETCKVGKIENFKNQIQCFWTYCTQKEKMIVATKNKIFLNVFFISFYLIPLGCLVDP